jgi:nicotinamide-nucleotide amidase
MKIAYLAIGNELLDGRIQDTNQTFTGRALRDRLVSLRTACVVPDDPVQIADAVRSLSANHDLLILSGGAGPTSDDVTRASMALAAGVELVRNAEAEQRLRAKFARFGVSMPENNLKQVDFPDGAVVLPNRGGTADGCELQLGDCRVFSFPGVPREFEALLTEFVLPAISTPERERWSRTLLGIGESHLAGLVDALTPLPSVSISYRASTPYVHLELSSNTGNEELARVTNALSISLAPWLIQGADAADQLAKLLQSRGMSVATAESCTGGLVASFLTDVAGASAVFHSGWVTYANDVKHRELGVLLETLEAHGAVSREVVSQMASGALSRSGADLSVALSGIAGPGGGSDEKPTGTVWIAVQSRHGAGVVLRAWLKRRDRRTFKHHAAVMALMAAARTIEGRTTDIHQWWGVEEVHRTEVSGEVQRP